MKFVILVLESYLTEINTFCYVCWLVFVTLVICSGFRETVFSQTWVIKKKILISLCYVNFIIIITTLSLIVCTLSFYNDGNFNIFQSDSSCQNAGSLGVAAFTLPDKVDIHTYQHYFPLRRFKCYFYIKKIEIVPVEKVGWFWFGFFFLAGYLSATFTSCLCSSSRYRHERSRQGKRVLCPEEGRVAVVLMGSTTEITSAGAAWSHATVPWLQTPPPGLFGNQ